MEYYAAIKISMPSIYLKTTCFAKQQKNKYFFHFCLKNILYTHSNLLLCRFRIRAFHSYKLYPLVRSPKTTEKYLVICFQVLYWFLTCLSHLDKCENMATKYAESDLFPECLYFRGHSNEKKVTQPSKLSKNCHPLGIWILKFSLYLLIIWI